MNLKYTKLLDVLIDIYVPICINKIKITNM